MQRIVLPSILAGIFTCLSTNAQANLACNAQGSLTIISATDNGLYDQPFGPHQSIDGNLFVASRWSSRSEFGMPTQLLLDLGATQSLKSLSIAWYKGDTRKAVFSVEASDDGSQFETIIPRRESNGLTSYYEHYDLIDIDTRYVRISGYGNDNNDWNSILEVAAFGCGVAVEKPDKPILTTHLSQGVMGLHTDVPPAKNFDLLGWSLTTPADDNDDGKADRILETALAAGWTDPRYFYTDTATGGMVFRSTPAGAKTSESNKFTRTELQSMLRRGDESIKPRLASGLPNKNNWVFSSAPAAAQAQAGGVDGVLKATLAVNQVTRLGDRNQIGRVVIGQIHGSQDEPIRLYYRKLPRNKFGSIYYAHEPVDGKEQWVELIGSRSNYAPNPDDGIALDETFSYEIAVTAYLEAGDVIPMLHVKLIRDDGTEIVAEPLDMRDSGFSVDNDYMFFKAGAYSQNNSSPDPEMDFDKVTFYKLEYANDDVSDAITSSKQTRLTSSTEAFQQSLFTIMNQSTIFNDSFTDGGRDNGFDKNDAPWWTTSDRRAIEVGNGFLGLVSGGAGSGIHTTFEPQKLTPGQTLQATFTFTTPDTVGSDHDSAFRIGIFDRLDRAALESDQSASSKEPNRLFDGLPGYMIDFDINLKQAGKTGIDIRKHKIDKQGRLLGTNKSFQRLGHGGTAYRFKPKTTYTGVMSISKLMKGLAIYGSISNDRVVLSEFSLTDEESDVNDFGMLAFHANSDVFGSSNEPGKSDNGIDFSNVKLEIRSEEH